MIAGATDDLQLPDRDTFILYLPGVSRQDLRAVESCPEHLKPIAELQYRGVIWSQGNAKDWTILAYFMSGQGGLGLDVALDYDARQAMQRALYRLLDEPIDQLRGRRLDKDYFNMLLSGDDPVRELLQWLDHADSSRSSRSENEWNAFVSVCQSRYAFDPENQSQIDAAARLAAHQGNWGLSGIATVNHRDATRISRHRSETPERLSSNCSTTLIQQEGGRSGTISRKINCVQSYRR